MNALAATAAAWAAGLNPAMIVRALTTFKTDLSMTPGRFNVYELNGIQVIVDYAHNAAAMAALGEAVEALEPRKTVMVLTLPGDRRDEDLIATTEATIPFVDSYVLYQDADPRGRDQDEIPKLIRSHLPAKVPCKFAADRRQAILKAWRKVQPGDRLIVIYDENVDEVVEILHTLAKSVTEDAACDSPLILELAEPRAERIEFPALLGVSSSNAEKERS
jgi:cyanophycin synthetase